MLLPSGRAPHRLSGSRKVRSSHANHGQIFSYSAFPHDAVGIGQCLIGEMFLVAFLADAQGRVAVMVSGNDKKAVAPFLVYRREGFSCDSKVVIEGHGRHVARKNHRVRIAGRDVACDRVGQFRRKFLVATEREVHDAEPAFRIVEIRHVELLVPEVDVAEVQNFHGSRLAWPIRVDNLSFAMRL